MHYIQVPLLPQKFCNASGFKFSHENQVRHTRRHITFRGLYTKANQTERYVLAKKNIKWKETIDICSPF